MELVKTTEKRPLGMSRRRWENNIIMDLMKRGISTRNWVDSVQDRDYWRTLVNTALNLISHGVRLHVIVVPVYYFKVRFLVLMVQFYVGNGSKT